MNFAHRPELLEQLAASYALGTLRGAARRRFEAVARQNVVVRAQALIWQERLASLTELQPSEAPSANVWKRIANVVESQRLDAAAALRRLPAAAAPPRRALGFWRVAAGIGACASVMAVVVGVQLSGRLDNQNALLADALQKNTALQAELQAMPDIQYVAVLSDDKAVASVLVTFDPKKQTLMLKRVADYHEAQDRSLQLWALPRAGAGPQSLGVLGEGKLVRLTAADSAVREMPALAISLEPKGGVSGEAGPTGPVLFKGALIPTSL